MFDFDVSDELKFVIKRLIKKDKKRLMILNKKIKEVINNDSETIDRYKNCKYDQKEYKRVHIDKSFILLFKVTKEKSHILFIKLGHHEDIF
jgi:mRNA-degrading endonuclease YafQ of YafQ-DinJ toxin-antitoxin module